MTREQRLKLFAFELYNKGFRFTDIKQIRKDNILTPYETEVIGDELLELEIESEKIDLNGGYNESNY